MKLHLVVVIYLATVGIIASREWKAGESFGPIAPNLKFIVTVDGKSYFAEREPAKTWTAAGNYCRTLGMRLATITSKIQGEALLVSYNSADFTGDFWTSGRDSQLSRQFSWNETGVETSSNLVAFWNGTRAYLTCLLYESRVNNGSFMVHYPCTGSWGTLCETT